jgi:hypothetical protein
MERNQALSAASEVISGCGGWIVDHALFSNMAANINFEPPLAATAQLIERLEKAGFSPKVEGDLPEGDTGDIRGCLMMSFLHDEPDLKRDVPAFG